MLNFVDNFTAVQAAQKCYWQSLDFRNAFTAVQAAQKS